MAPSDMLGHLLGLRAHLSPHSHFSNTKNPSSMELQSSWELSDSAVIPDHFLGLDVIHI